MMTAAVAAGDGIPTFNSTKLKIRSQCDSSTEIASSQVELFADIR